MEELLYLFFIYRFLFGFAFLASLLVYFHEDWPGYLQFFPPFLFLSILVDIAARDMAAKYGSNHALYNVYHPLYQGFYLFILSYILKSRKFRKPGIYIACVYLPVCYINLAFAKIHEVQVGTYLLGGFLIIIFCLANLVELIRFRRTDFLSREPSFWICCGLLYLQAGTLILIGTINLTMEYSIEQIRVPQRLLMLVQYLYFIFLSVAFLCQLKFRRKA